jgi:sugar phosphate isomerase/epimerase
MGAPKWDIYEVIRRFREIGYDAVEVRVAPDGQIDSETVTNEECERILAAARAEGMAFSCLTSRRI